MRSLPSIITAFIAAAAICACSSSPRGIIGKEKMARILADLSIAEGIVEADRHTYSTDSARILLRQSIYARNGVTTEMVDSSMKWYGYHMDKYVEVYDLAIELVEKDIQTTTASAGATRQSSGTTSIYATEGDSVDVWQGQKLRVFAANMPSDFTTFYLVNDRNWENGDVYTLSARISGMGDSPLRMSIAAEYPDGSRDYVTSDTKSNGWQHLDLPLKSDKKASLVFGYIHSAPAGKDVVIADSISLIRRRAANVSVSRGSIKETSPLYGR